MTISDNTYCYCICRLYAGVVTDIINDTEFKIKYFGYEKEVSLPKQSLMHIKAEDPAALVPKDQLKVGTKCMAKYSEDQQFYQAMITSITSHGYQLQYTEYGNHEEVPYEYIKMLNNNDNSNSNSSSSGKNELDNKRSKEEKVDDIENSFITIPKSLEILPTDTEEEKNRKRKKIKNIKNKNRIIAKDVEVQKVQKSWQNFVSKVSVEQITATESNI